MDFKDMRKKLIDLEIGFKDLSILSGLPYYKLVKAANGFGTLSELEEHMIEEALERLENERAQA